MSDKATPVFNLVYFRQAHFRELDGGVGRKRFPVTPDEVIAGECMLVVYSESSAGEFTTQVPVSDVGTLKNTFSLWRFGGPPLIEAPTWSVHPGRVLLRLLRFLDLDAPPKDGEFRAIKEGNTYDIVESFHAPSVMTMSERVAFSTEEVARWVNIKVPEDSHDSETAILAELIRREMTRS